MCTPSRMLVGMALGAAALVIVTAGPAGAQSNNAPVQAVVWAPIGLSDCSGCEWIFKSVAYNAAIPVGKSASAFVIDAGFGRVEDGNLATFLGGFRFNTPSRFYVEGGAGAVVGFGGFGNGGFFAVAVGAGIDIGRFGSTSARLQGHFLRALTSGGGGNAIRIGVGISR